MVSLLEEEEEPEEDREMERDLDRRAREGLGCEWVRSLFTAPRPVRSSPRDPVVDCS